MKLSLTNFRCHKNKVFECDDNGLILLNGKNGQGKSTIFEAIYFALYGDVKKPYSFGTKTCKVVLDYYNIKITRTSTPNRVVVFSNDKEYEGESAQSIINEKIMNMHEFLASSYIKQKSNNSILTMTPVQQVQFIKNLVLDMEINTKLKERIKDLIKDAHDDISRENGKLDVITSQIKKFSLDSKSSLKENPLKDTTEEEFKEKYSKLEENIKKWKKQKLVLEGDIKKQEEFQKQNENDMKNQDKISLRLELLKDQLSKFQDIKPIQLKKYNKDLENIKLNIKILEEIRDKNKKYIDIEKKINEINIPSEDEIENYKKYLEYQDFKFKVDEIKENFKTEYKCKKIQKYDAILKKMKEKHKIDVYNCPSCEANLCFTNNHLIITEYTPNSGDKDLSKEISMIEEFLNMKEPPKVDINENYEENIKKFNELNILLNNYTSDETFDEKEYESLITQMNEITEIIKQQNDKQKLQQEYDSLYDQLSSYKDDENICDLTETYKKLQEILSKINKGMEHINKMNNTKLELFHYNNYLKLNNQLETLNKEKEEYDTKLTNYKSKQNNLVIIREKSKLAELLALEGIIQNINEQAKYYLDMMFTSDPIIVKIETFKNVKSDVKFQMNTYINYKGEEYDNIDQLSGGERQKCELAFSLAVNAIMNSKIMMLDECINNLDTEVNTEILRLLLDFSQTYNKLILVVSHECVNGLFDKIIDI